MCVTNDEANCYWYIFMINFDFLIFPNEKKNDNFKCVKMSTTI